MDKRRSHSKTRSGAARGNMAAAVARSARQPTRALIAGLLWIVFMLVVWFQTPGVRLPTFFQRMVGIAHALLTMLVVMFAIREYGKRYNRVPLPLLGRVSTSRVAGGLVFLAVLGWWISPWAPIPAGQPEPDLWRLLEDGLDTPLLQVVDTNLATLVSPAPSAAARQAAQQIAANGDPLRTALVAIASGKFDDAGALLNRAASARAAGPSADMVEQARAQLDLYRGPYAAAERRYGEMLKVQPRREDFLAHGALAAALASDFSTAAAWAEQLLDQARARTRVSARTVEAANLLAVVRLLAGDDAEALRVGQTMLGGRDGNDKLLPRDSTDSAGPPDAAAANNAAVIRLLAGAAEVGGPSPSSDFALAQKLWLDRNTTGGRPRETPDPRTVLERFNLGMAALQEARYDQADTLLTESLAAWQKFSSPPTQPHAAINLNALARLDLIEGRYSRAASRAREAADLFAPARADDPSALASKTTLTELDASLGRYDQAIGSLRESVHEAELGRRGLPPKHPYVAILKLRLAGIFLRAGRNTDAQASAGEAQKILADAGLNASRPAADALRIGGLAALRQGNRELSERQFDRAQKLLRPADDNHPVPASPELAALLAAQGELAGDLQNYTEAADDYRQAIEQLSQMFESRAANHPLRAEYLQALAKLLVREERPTEAKPLLEESLTIDRRALPPAHAATISVMADLAAVLEKTGSKSQAEELRKQAKQLRAQRSVTP